LCWLEPLDGHPSVHEQAMARANVAHQLGGDQLLAASLVVAPGIRAGRAHHR